MDTENQNINTDNVDAKTQKLLTNIADAEAEAEREKERKREKEKEREMALKKAKESAKKRKLIPPFVMLLAGAIISITMFLRHYESKTMLTTLLWVLIVFFIAGEILKWMLDRFEAQIEEARMEEGEVIEKEPDEADGAAKTEKQTEDGEKLTAS